MFSDDGEFALNAIKEHRIIKRKNFSDERIVDEIFKFYTHYQTNNHLMTLDVSDSYIKAEFEKWLIRDLCKAEKPKEQKKKSEYIAPWQKEANERATAPVSIKKYDKQDLIKRVKDLDEEIKERYRNLIRKMGHDYAYTVLLKNTTQ